MKITNQFMISQCNNLKTYLNHFANGLEMAARQDDGTISREEEKFISIVKKHINRLRNVIDTFI